MYKKKWKNEEIFLENEFFNIFFKNIFWKTQFSIFEIHFLYDFILFCKYFYGNNISSREIIVSERLTNDSYSVCVVIHSMILRNRSENPKISGKICKIHKSCKIDIWFLQTKKSIAIQLGCSSQSYSWLLIQPQLAVSSSKSHDWFRKAKAG